MPVSVIILAAGSSTRMGSSKQLLRWGEGTLLGHAVKTAMDSRAGHVLVVLGSNESAHLKALENLPVTIVSNPDWQKGMGSSLKVGLAAARETSEAVIVMVCDMPFVTSQHLNNIIDHFTKTSQPIVASKYEDTVGVPALFSKKVFDELSRIGDEEGARKIIAKHKDAALIHLESPSDIDTYEDYLASLRARQ
jgi:molybdenum cofactor cytidylyltransferase